MSNNALTRRTSTPYPWGAVMQRFFDQDPLFRDFASSDYGSQDLSGAWRPSVDLREEDDAWLISADLPGLSREDVDVTVENNTLTLSGERKLENAEKNESYHRIERAYGRFTRSFSLPSNISSEEIGATFKDGVLTLRLPKTETAKPRKIEIA